MKKIHLLTCLFVLFAVASLHSETAEKFWRGKVIFVNQYTQEITAFLDGRPLRVMETITGDAKHITPQGIYRVEHKSVHYHSRRWDASMPYSIFFIWTNDSRMAIHEGIVPARKKRSKWATGGCPHLEHDNILWLYKWAEEKTTRVVVFGDRSQD